MSTHKKGFELSFRKQAKPLVSELSRSTNRRNRAWGARNQDSICIPSKVQAQSDWRLLRNCLCASR